MKQYLNVLNDILKNGREKESGRENMPNTIGLSHATILMGDVFENYPLLTTKRMFWKGIVHELLWFLRGETNIKYLVDNNVNIWNGDAYRWYLKWWEESGSKQDGLRKLETMEEFIEQVKQDSNPEYYWKSIERLHHDEEVTYTVGDLGKVYGYQWRNQNGVDQVSDVFYDLKNNPYGRYKIIDGWNKRDFPEMALPPCHLLYQFIVRPMTNEERNEYLFKNLGFLATGSKEAQTKRLDSWNVPKYFLDLNMYQRSCDTFLGVPFNIASMSLLLIIIAKAVGMIPGEAFWIGGDTHLYISHLDAVREQLSRTPKNLPRMKIKKEISSLDDICALTIDDFELVGYQSHDKIEAELFTGLKKK